MSATAARRSTPLRRSTGLDRPTDVSRLPVPPLEPHWVIVDELPVFHRTCLDAGPVADTIVHVHGFGISGHVPRADRGPCSLHVTAATSPTCREWGESMRPRQPLDLPGLARRPHGLLRCRRGRTGDVGRQLAGLPDHPRGRDRVPRPHHPRRPGLAGRRAQQPAAGARAPADGDRRSREPPSMLPIAARDYLRFGRAAES